MKLNRDEYRSKVLGCWLGKNIGGTLGAPFEWKRQLNDVSFYTQDLGGEPLPNDDLDIQLLWLIALEEAGVALDARLLAEYWLTYVTPHWAEYGTAKANLRSGLMPPLSGTVGNVYKHSCGAFIRSEIWACIAPGAPELAAEYAYYDAILDHGDGEGTYAELFCAAIESAAFVVSNIDELLKIGKSYLPDGCAVGGAIDYAVEAHRRQKPWKEARDAILRDFRGGLPGATCEADRQKGFADGPQGFDVPSNIGMLMIALLYGEGDFAKSVCMAVNCGEDTDCTGATVGSLHGILHGADSIPAEWIAPIGRTIKTACLNLGELGHFGSRIAQDVDDLTARTETIAEQVALRHNLPLRLTDGATDLADLNPAKLLAGRRVERLYRHLDGPLYRFDAFEIAVGYPQGPHLREGAPTPIKLTIYPENRVQMRLNLRWYTPDYVMVSPAAEGSVLVLTRHLQPNAPEVTFEIEADYVPLGATRLVLEITVEGRHTALLVPVVLVSGSLESGT